MKCVQRRVLSLVLGVIILFIGSRCVAAEYSLLSKGKYFTVYARSGADLSGMLNRLNYQEFARFDALGGQGGDTFNPASILAHTLDGIYQEVSDILGIRLSSYHGKIVFVSNQAEVSTMFYAYFGQDFPERSFYIHEKNTIYISEKDLSLGMLGHEIAHAVISHYFVVPPTTKVQEVLAGYVEYNLRKASGTLPR
ncbi:MAG: hypothetical protein JXD21_08175 [Candidatus Omnitrophica bacterium]|nr:hypothetical protein [Candidatus Omnitrophota bacterium]